jgi:hypothetical protein
VEAPFLSEIFLALARNALENNSTGNFNVAEGAFALSGNFSGSSNIAIGVDAGSHVTSGSDNIDTGARGAADESSTIRIGTPAKQGSRISRVSGGCDCKC